MHAIGCRTTFLKRDICPMASSTIISSIASIDRRLSRCGVGARSAFFVLAGWCKGECNLCSALFAHSAPVRWQFTICLVLFPQSNTSNGGQLVCCTVCLAKRASLPNALIQLPSNSAVAASKIRNKIAENVCGSVDALFCFPVPFQRVCFKLFVWKGCFTSY